MENLEHKSRVTYTCGHSGGDPLGKQIEVKTITPDGHHAIDGMVVCDRCIVWYRKNGLVIDNEIQKNKWLNP